MTRHTDVVALSGSLAEDSVTRLAVQEAISAAEAAGANTTAVDLRTVDLPTFDADRQDAGDAPALRRRLGDADAVLLATPMYHGSYSSALKTALDYAGIDEFEDTTVGLVAVSGGAFPMRALDHLRAVVLALEAWPLPLDVAIAESSTRVEAGSLVDESIRDRLHRLGAQLVDYAALPAQPTPADLPRSGVAD